MRTLSLSLLTAGLALTATGALAADGPGGPPPGPPPGTTWHGPPPGAGMPHGPNVMIRRTGPGPMRPGGPGPMGPGGPGPMMHGGGGMHGGMNFPHRMRRGTVIPPFFFGSQFYLGDWQTYGFSDPGPDGRWIRYYDDAYLIDGGGRVLDERYGVQWDNYGEEWGDHDGIPAYRGDWREGGEGGEDYAEEEYREEHRGARGGHQGGGYGGPGHGPPPPGYGNGAAYGGYYGYGAYAYPIVIETITTTGGGYSEEIVEEYVEIRQRHRARRPRVRCQCAPAPRPAVRRPAPRRRPPAGERG